MSMWRSGRKQREPRRRLNKPGWISAGGSFGVQRCTIENISAGGAQLLVANPRAVPSDFVLSFTQGERGGKRCHVVWRTGSTIGVRFAK